MLRLFTIEIIIVIIQGGTYRETMCYLIPQIPTWFCLRFETFVYILKLLFTFQSTWFCNRAADNQELESKLWNKTSSLVRL